MKKLLVPLAAILLLALAVPAFADWELGIGITPSQNSTSTDPGQVNSILDFHVAYAYSILYFAWDAYAMPAYWVYNATTYIDPTSGYVVSNPSDDVPGFLNTFDIGLRFILRPIVFYGEIGTNLLYLYGGSDLQGPERECRRRRQREVRGWSQVRVLGCEYLRHADIRHVDRHDGRFPPGFQYWQHFLPDRRKRLVPQLRAVLLKEEKHEDQKNTALGAARCRISLPPVEL